MTIPSTAVLRAGLFYYERVLLPFYKHNASSSRRTQGGPGRRSNLCRQYRRIRRLIDILHQVRFLKIWLLTDICNRTCNCKKWQSLQNRQSQLQEKENVLNRSIDVLKQIFELQPHAAQHHTAGGQSVTRRKKRRLVAKYTDLECECSLVRCSFRRSMSIHTTPVQYPTGIHSKTRYHLVVRYELRDAGKMLAISPNEVETIHTRSESRTCPQPRKGSASCACPNCVIGKLSTEHADQFEQVYVQQGDVLHCTLRATVAMGISGPRIPGPETHNKSRSTS